MTVGVGLDDSLHSFRGDAHGGHGLSAAEQRSATPTWPVPARQPKGALPHPTCVTHPRCAFVELPVLSTQVPVIRRNKGAWSAVRRKPPLMVRVETDKPKSRPKPAGFSG